MAGASLSRGPSEDDPAEPGCDPSPGRSARFVRWAIGSTPEVPWYENGWAHRAATAIGLASEYGLEPEALAINGESS